MFNIVKLTAKNLKPGQTIKTVFGFVRIITTTFRSDSYFNTNMVTLRLIDDSGDVHVVSTHADKEFNVHDWESVSQEDYCKVARAIGIEQASGRDQMEVDGLRFQMNEESFDMVLQELSKSYAETIKGNFS